eukprot:1137764-Pelagomonas_calceolata.AAC.1
MMTGGRPTDYINKIQPAWPSEHGSKEKELDKAENIEGRQERARCLAKLTGLLQSNMKRMKQID